MNKHFTLHSSPFTQMRNLIHHLNEQVGRAVSWLNLALVLLICGDVVFRYVFNDSAAWVMELEWHLFALVFLFGAGYALRHGRHVRVDVFYHKMKVRDQALVDAIGGLILLIPWCIFMIWLSIDYALVSWQVGEGSPDPGGLPARYLIKFAIPVSIFLLLLQGIAMVREAISSFHQGRRLEGEDETAREGL